MRFSPWPCAWRLSPAHLPGRPPAPVQELRILGQRPHLRGPQSLESLSEKERWSLGLGSENLHFKQCCLRVGPRRGPRSSRSSDKALPSGAAGVRKEGSGGAAPTAVTGEVPGTQPTLLCNRVRGGRAAQALGWAPGVCWSGLRLASSRGSPA